MEHKIFEASFASIYPNYILKAEKKGKTIEQVNDLIYWLTGYTSNQLEIVINNDISFREFFDQAPRMNPNAGLVKGVICGIRVEDVEDDLMRNIRYLDKLIDELAKGKKIENIKRK